MQLPQEVQSVLTKLHDAGFEAYAVGGCTRDLLLKQTPKDWDITTNAKPEEIQQVFPKSFYANQFGTVTVLTKAEDPTLREIEITTYRIETTYTDQRHPDSVSFTKNLEEDLARRDFTINAMAMAQADSSISKAAHSITLESTVITDPFGGLKDLNSKLIRAVGNPQERFSEDALRLMRAVRFAAQLGFSIEGNTKQAIKAQASSIKAVSQERIRDELVKIVMSDKPEMGMNLLQETGLLAYILPELQEGVGVGQNKHHIYTVFDHCVKSLQFAAQYDYSQHVRLAALFHDIGKPRTKRRQGSDYTFYAHEIVGARMTEKLMKRLRFSNELTKKVTNLVRHHMFHYEVGEITESGIRRLLRRVGSENFDDLIRVRIAERKGSGVPKAQPYRLRHLRFMADKVSQQAISVGQLTIDGNDLIKDLGVKPGPIIGGILNALLAEVIEDPSKNIREYLLKRAEELEDKNPDELKKLGSQAVEEEEKKREDDIRRKYHV